jgi:hypothetical protein
MTEYPMSEYANDDKQLAIRIRSDENFQELEQTSHFNSALRGVFTITQTGESLGK